MCLYFQGKRKHNDRLIISFARLKLHMDNCIRDSNSTKGIEECCERRSETKPLPKQICFTDLTQFDKFMEEMNKIHQCCSPGSSGNFAHVSVQTKGLEVAVTVDYAYDGCANQTKCLPPLT